MNQKNKLKIAIVTVTLSKGGAERVAAHLSHFFENQNIEVVHIVFSGEIEYNYKGKIYHLEQLKDNHNSWWSRGKRFLELRRIFKKEQFNLIIDFRTRHFFWQEFIINRFIYKDFLQTIHSYNLNKYLINNNFIYKFLYKKDQQFITVSKEIEEKIKSEGYNNVVTIENPFVLENSYKEINFDGDFIISAGNMNENIKQFDLLIECYSKSILVEKNIKLIILGEGKLKSKFIEQVKALNLEEYIFFLGFVSNPNDYFRKALYYVSSSQYEGFPMVLIEALSCELPIISWNYKSGPSEIITNENGILVENLDQNQLVDAMNLLIKDREKLSYFKKNALKSIEKFSLKNIGEKWLTLLKN